MTEKPKWTDVANVLVSFALLACAITAGIVSYWQWKAAADQLEFARKSAADSGRDTREALALSRKVAASAERQALASQEQLRAYMYVHKFSLELLNNNKTAKVAVTVENGGETPASEIEIEVAALLWKGDKIIYGKKWREYLGGQIFKRRKDTLKYEYEFGDIGKKWRNDTFKFVAAVTIIYVDVFERKRTHWIVVESNNCSVGKLCRFGILNAGPTPDEDAFLKETGAIPSPPASTKEK